MKSYVTLEQKHCAVCGKNYETGALLMDKRMRFEKYTVTGVGLCPEDQKKFDEGYIALIEVDPKKSAIEGDRLKPEKAYRTGRVAHIKSSAFNKVFNIPLPEKTPILFVDEEIIDKILEMQKKK
jgi:hypothetical protein